MIARLFPTKVDRHRELRMPPLIAWIALVLGLTIGCHKQGEEYFPVGPVGAQSDYTIQYIAPLIGLQKAQMTMRWEGTKEISGVQYYKRVIAYSGLPGATPDVSYCRRASDGIHCISDSQPNLPDYLEQPIPVTVGMTWTTKAPASTTESKAESIETLELFDRKYEKCLRVTSNVSESGKSLSETSYYAPSVGLVKFTFTVSGITFDGALDTKK